MEAFLTLVIGITIFIILIWCISREPKQITYTPIVAIYFIHINVNQVFRYNYKWWRKKDQKTAISLDNSCEALVEWNTPVGALLKDVPDDYGKYILNYDQTYN